jgi:SAM-dependent methyltransferase
VARPDRPDRESRRWTFDRAPELYDRGRPPYPAEIFDDLAALAHLPAGAAVVEIGCGPGRASRMLAAKGCRLTCLELGPRMAEVARRNLAAYPDARVITSSFEAWDAAGARFDMVFAASSWHWLDLDTRYAKAAQLLRARGALAMLGASHAYPPGFDPFFAEIRRCYEELGEARSAWPPPPPEQIPDRSEEIEASGLFAVVAVKRYLWAADYTADGYIDELSTHSGYALWPQEKRDRLHAEIRRLIGLRPAGRIRKHYLSVLTVCRPLI